MLRDIIIKLGDRFNWYPLFIKVAVIMVFTCVVVFIVTNLVILLKRIFDAILGARLKKARHIVANELSEQFMVGGDIDETEVDKLAGRLQRLSVLDRIFSQVIIDELIFYHHTFTGKVGRMLQRVYRKLNMVDRSIEKIRSAMWNIKAKGLRELQEMPLGKQGNNLIAPLLNDNNPDLRVEAQAAHIRFNRNDPFSFLDAATEQLFEWHQIILFELAVNTEGLIVPEFKKWLTSANQSVVCFAIKMIIHYQQLDAGSDLEKLLDHPDESVRRSAIHALGKLDIVQAEEKLKEIYVTEETLVKASILDALGVIASNNNIKFLQQQFLNTQEFSLVKSAGCALANQQGFDDEMFAAENLAPLQLSVMNHCTNYLIRH